MEITGLQVKENKDSPICEALRDKGAPDPKATAAKIPEKVQDAAQVIS